MYVRAPKFASRTPLVTSIATQLSAKSSFLNQRSTVMIERKRQQTLLIKTSRMTASESTLSAVRLGTARAPTRFALRIIAEWDTVIQLNAKTYT